MADDHPTKPSRESMREVKKEFKARRRAERERARAAQAYWEAETGRARAGAGRSRGSGRGGAAAALVVVVTLGVVGATAVLHVGPFAPSSSAAGAPPVTTAASPPVSSPTSTAASPSSTSAAPSSAPPVASAEGHGTADPGTGLAGALYRPGSCPSEYLVNPAGGRRVVTGSCDGPHAAEVVEVVAGATLWTSYPTKAQRERFNQLCYVAAMDYLGFRGPTKELQAYVDRVLRDRGIGGLAAFPAASSWAVDKGVMCALTTTGALLPAGSLKGTIPS